MLNSNAVFLNGTAIREFKIHDDHDHERRPRGNDAPIVILCRVVELLRSCAGPHLPSYLFGYDPSARLVSLGESEMRGSPIAEDEARNIIDVLKVEDGIQSRPCIRADRVRAATAAFKSGGNTFHALFDKDFANRFVKTSIIDSKAKIASNGKDVKDFTEEQLEIIVAEEEYQIKSKIKKSAFMSVLAFLGIASF